MTNPYDFRDDPTTHTDDYLIKSIAGNDRMTTTAGFIVMIVSAISPLAILFAPVSDSVKIAAFGGSSIMGVAGSALGRQQPIALASAFKKDDTSI